MLVLIYRSFTRDEVNPEPMKIVSVVDVPVIAVPQLMTEPRVPVEPVLPVEPFEPFFTVKVDVVPSLFVKVYTFNPASALELVVCAPDII